MEKYEKQLLNGANWQNDPSFFFRHKIRESWIPRRFTVKIKIAALFTGSLVVASAQAEELFAFESAFAQSSSYQAFPIGFWQGVNGTYSLNLELLGGVSSATDNRSRWIKSTVTSPSGNLRTAETTPQLNPVQVNCVNASGLACGWAKRTSTIKEPCTWDTSGLAADITAVPLTSFDSSFPNGEALMINAAGTFVGYYGTSLSLDVNQRPFVTEATSSNSTALIVPMGFVDGRATCINGKTNTPESSRIGGWKRADGGVRHAMLWKKVGSNWVEETIVDTDNVLANRETWIADINDNGVCVGRIESAVGIASNETLDASETGGLFIYSPGDKVRRINLTGLSNVVPIRINNSKEIAVNRNDVTPSQPKIVFPKSESNSAIRGSVVDWQALVDPDSSPTPQQVFDFHDNRQWSGVADSSGTHYSRVYKPSTAWRVVPPSSVTIGGFTNQSGNLTSLSLLDGDYMELTFDSNTSIHTVDLYWQPDGIGFSRYITKPTVRAMTSGSYTVVETQFGSGGSSVSPSKSFGRDFVTLDGGGNNNSTYHNPIHIQLAFFASLTSATPSIQIERTGFALKN